MKKRGFVLLLALLLALGTLCPAGAAEEPGIQLDGVMTGAIPRLSRGRAYLPAEELACLLGAELETAGTAATLSRGERSVTLEEIRMGEESYLPVRAAGAGLGYQVGWDRGRRVVLLADRETLRSAGEGMQWKLAEAEVQAGLLTELGSSLAGKVARELDPGDVLGFIPLTDADTAFQLLSRAAEALKGAEEATLALGDTSVELWRKGEETCLRVCLPAEAVLPAQRLGLKENEITMTFTAGEREAQALVTVGDWQASARWTA